MLTRVNDELWPVASENLEIIVIGDNLRDVDFYQVFRKPPTLTKTIVVLPGNMLSWGMWGENQLYEIKQANELAPD